jgi:hypothetical protein
MLTVHRYTLSYPLGEIKRPATRSAARPVVLPGVVAIGVAHRVAPQVEMRGKI